jgi:hypothetical protein
MAGPWSRGRRHGCWPSFLRASSYCVREDSEEEWLWRLEILRVGVQNNQMQGERAPIYRRSSRVRVSLVDLMGWAGLGPKHKIGLR